MGLDLGRDLGTPRLSWRRLWLIIERLPETSALFAERNPDTYRWGLSEQLLAMVADALNIANWMNSEDGRRKRHRPEPIPRPGVNNKNTKTFGTTRMSFAEADAWLAGDGVTYTTVANDLVA